MTNYETLDDIEDDLRSRADVAERIADSTTHNEGVAMLLRSFADRIKAAAKRERENQNPYMDLGCAGVATVHHYEVRVTVAGRCDLMATFTDPKRAMEYAENLALELNEFYGGEEEGEE